MNIQFRNEFRAGTTSLEAMPHANDTYSMQIEVKTRNTLRSSRVLLLR